LFEVRAPAARAPRPDSRQDAGVNRAW
jgi:hypothetical protein